MPDFAYLCPVLAATNHRTTASSLKTFVIYAREDRDALLELKKQLIPLERRGQISIWHDGEIVPGEEWEKAIKLRLETADLILLLLSSDFFASDYIEKKELKEALLRHARGESTVAPVIVRHCLWQEHPEIEKLQVLPDNAHPIYAKKQWDSPDEAFANVAAGIARLLRARVAEKTEAEANARKAAERAETEAARPKALPYMVLVKGGTFQMGDKDIATPVHPVTLSDFEIGKYPVTQKLWTDLMGNNPSKFQGDDLPVETVSWEDVQDFLKKLNARHPGKNYRLPTEAEWEFAARGGTLSKGYTYAGSNDLKEVGWFWENSGDKPLSGEWKSEKLAPNNCRTHPVGQKKANELGIHDMSGNVWEWCQDWYEAYKDSKQPVNNPTGTATDSRRVSRGGSWRDESIFCRVAFRLYWNPNLRLNDLGFRLARTY